MQRCRLPHPLYERVRDHLEQAMAILPRDTIADSLGVLLDEAIDIAIELAYRTPTDEPPVRLIRSDKDNGPHH